MTSTLSSESSAVRRLILRNEVEEFLFRESRLLEEERFDEWLSLLTSDVEYTMPIRETRTTRAESIQADGLKWFDHDRVALENWVKRLGTGMAHAETPPSRTRRFVTNVTIRTITEGELEVESNVLLFQSRLEHSDAWFVALRADRMVRDGGEWKLSSRRILPDQRMMPRAISVLL